MIIAFRYARKKYRERQQVQADQQPKEDQRTATPNSAPTTTGTYASGDAIIETQQYELTNGHSSPDAAGSKARDARKEDREREQMLIEKKRRRVYRYKIIFGLMAPFTLQALDKTIIASALPFIAADFNQISQLNWIISVFNLTTAAFLPFWAQVSDIFGRHGTIQAAIIIMTIGSAICTGAPTNAFAVLLLGRALQGVGCAGVDISVRTILADKVSLADLALNWTIFALMSAVSFSIGPVAGGYLTQVSWRWCFGINLPVAALAILGVALLIRKELLGPQPLPELEDVDTSRRRGRLALRLATFDYGGQFLFLWGLGLLILAFTWAGGTYSWDSAAVLVPLVLGIVLTTSWFVYEYLMMPNKYMARIFPLQRAMMPWSLISQRDIGLLFLINFGVGMAMFAIMYFMDLYFVLVQGNSPSKAGIALLYFLPGLGVGSYMSMFASNVWPRQTLPSLVTGSITSAVGITVLAWATYHDNIPLIYGMMALTGHGVGFRLSAGTLHGLAYFPAATAQITCLVSFAMPFGGTVALTMMSTVFNNKSGDQQQNPRDGIMWGLVALIPFMWLVLLLSTFMGNVWLLKDGGHEVVRGSYIWSLLTRKELVKERRVRGELADAASSRDGNGIEATVETKGAGERNGAENV